MIFQQFKEFSTTRYRIGSRIRPNYTGLQYETAEVLLLHSAMITYLLCNKITLTQKIKRIKAQKNRGLLPRSF